VTALFVLPFDSLQTRIYTHMHVHSNPSWSALACVACSISASFARLCRAAHYFPFSMTHLKRYKHGGFNTASVAASFGFRDVVYLSL
jgi:hypothetical protein